jgi:anti-sigma factor RsiW
MNQAQSTGCDENLLCRYMDDDLLPAEQAQVEEHLDRCHQCRQQVAAMHRFSKHLCDRVRQAADDVDFTALEKSVLNKALRQRHPRGGWATFFASLKYTIPATIAAGLLFFFGYSQFMSEPVTAPSAIINSFTGSMSSVMIFETPETRQTILWYKEDADVESEHNAV